MARPKLTADEADCPVCKIPLKSVADRTEKITTKQPTGIFDVNGDEIKNPIWIEKACYCWQCPNCGLELTISK
jgi:hypothetical protein